MKTGEFLTIQARGAASVDSTLYPSWGETGLELEPGEHLTETLASKFTRCYGNNKKQVWNLEGQTKVVVSNRRVSYLCEKFVKGGGFSLTTQAVRGAIAVARRSGRVASGQVRYEWPASVQLSLQSGLGIKGAYIILECEVPGNVFEVWFAVNRDSGPSLAKHLAQLIAHYRLTHASALDLDPASRNVLEGQLAEPIAHESIPRGALIGKETRFVYDLPGAVPCPF